MLQAVSSTTLHDAVDALCAALDLPRQAYFADLRSGRMTRAGFVAGQLQFRFAVEQFARPMCLLATRVPPGPARDALLANIADEHGHGDPAGSHAQTFRSFLRRLGVPDARIDATPAGPAVRQFNATLMGVASHEPTRMGLAMLGVIEHLFATFSAWIGQAVQARGWLTAPQMVHYTTHETLDVEHARGFLDPLLPDWPQDAAIDAGLTLGAHAFLALYVGLHAAGSHVEARR